MRTAILLLAPLFNAFLAGHALPVAAQSPEQPWKALYDHRDSYPAMTYDVAFRMKMFGRDDTFGIDARVTLVRKTSDNFFGGKVLIDMDTAWIGYDGTHILAANRRDSTLTVVDPALNPGAYIKSTVYQNLLEKSFFTGGRSLLGLEADTSLAVRYIDTTWNGHAAMAIQVDFPAADGYSGEYTRITMSPETHYFTHRVHSVWFQENEQYTSWTFSNVRFSSDTIIDAFDEAAMGGFNRIRYGNDEASPQSSGYPKDTTQVDRTMLAGKWLDDGNTFSLDAVKGELILLDFWYSACYPCIKSIPYVNALYRKYKDKGLSVIGIDPIDDAVQDSSRLVRFVRNNPMEYRTVILEEDARPHWQGMAYPTVILMDRGGRILFKKSGYNANMTEILSTEIEKYLN